MGKVEIINPLTCPHWNELVLCHQQSTIFHSANWARAIAETYRFIPAYFAILDGDSLDACVATMDVAGFFTRRGVSLSFSDTCCSLVKDPQLYNPILTEILRYGRENSWRSVEFRAESLLAGQVPSQSYFHHEIELSTDDKKMFSRLRQNHARNIGKAIREGVRVEFSTDLQGVMAYYRLHCLTRKRQGLPPQPAKFFKKIYQHVISQGMGFTALGMYQGAAVAGLICLLFNGHAVYKYGASDNRYQNLRPSNLVLWETMRRCVEDGCHSMSLGRTDLGNDGLLFFKDGWGAVASMIHYYKYDFLTEKFSTGKTSDLDTYQKVLKKLPIPVLRGIGKLLYRHVG